MTETITYTETELVERLKQYDETAYKYLYDNYSKSLFTVIYQMISRQEEAEDILQQVFIKIWKSIAQYDSTKGRLFTWMLNITRNQAIDYTRSKDFNRSEKTIPLPETVYDGVTEASISDSGLKKVLEKLPAEHRKLLELSYFTGYTHQEIAGILGMPLGTVKTRLRNIIIELRKKMDINS